MDPLNSTQFQSLSTFCQARFWISGILHQGERAFLQWAGMLFLSKMLVDQKAGMYAQLREELDRFRDRLFFGPDTRALLDRLQTYRTNGVSLREMPDVNKAPAMPAPEIKIRELRPAA